MRLLKRLGFYLIGLAIGLIFLAFFLSRKRAEFCYFPNCRVLRELRSKPIEYSAALMQDLKDRKIDTTTILNFLSDGDVDFRASDTKSVPCKIYIIEAEIDHKNMALTVKNCDSLVIAQQLQYLD